MSIQRNVFPLTKILLLIVMSEF